MSIFDFPNFLWISLLAMLILTLFCTLVLNRWFIAAIISFIVLGILAFLMPNFYDITYKPLLGYAAFVAVISLIISILLWYFTRDWRKKRQMKKYEKERAAFEKRHHP